MTRSALIFAYQEVGALGLETLLASPHWRPAALVTHEDDPKEARWFRSVADLARASGIPVRTWEGMDRGDLDRLVAEARPDAVFSFYFRELLPVEAFAGARLGAYNLHGSLLPAYRGRAPVNWVLVRGEERTGVTLHHMVAKADAGDIVAQESLDIAPDDTAASLYRKMLPRFRSVLEGALPAIAAGAAPRIPQDHSRASYFGRRRPEDGLIDWSWNAWVVDRLVRAVARPYPGAFIAHGGRKLVVWAGRALDEAAGEGSPGEVLGLDASGVRVRCGVSTVGRVTPRDAMRVYRVERCAWEAEAEAEAAAVLGRCAQRGAMLGGPVAAGPAPG